MEWSNSDMNYKRQNIFDKDVFHISCPHLEPINGAAVDEGRELPKSVAEGVSDGAHSEHNV